MSSTSCLDEEEGSSLDKISQEDVSFSRTWIDREAGGWDLSQVKKGIFYCKVVMESYHCSLNSARS